MNKKNRSKFVRFTQMGLQMGVTIGGFVWLGIWIDSKGNEGQQLFTIILSLVGVILSMIIMIREVNRISKEENKNE